MVRPYRGVSAQDRRDDRRARLLEACFDVVADVGVADTTAEAVSTRAALSKRYFYESFADRDAILVAALDVVFADVSAAIITNLSSAGAGTDERIAVTVQSLVSTLTADPRAARLYIEASHQPLLEQRRVQAFDEFSQLMNRTVLQLDIDDPRARIAALLIVAGTTEVMSRWLSGALQMPEEDLIQTIAGIGTSVAAAIKRAQP